MDYKKLSRIVDSRSIDSTESHKRYFFYDPEFPIWKDLTFDELVELVLSCLNPSGELYKRVKEDNSLIWNIEWDLIGDDYEEIVYDEMENIDNYELEDESEED